MGGIPSRDSTTLYSYFRGTYEIGLIPLTKRFFGRPGSKDDPTATSLPAAAAMAGAQRKATRELRSQFVHMRSDPAIIYANARKTVYAAWQNLLSDPFTEDDLDALLDTVDEGLYNTEAEMVEDSQSPLVPVPCALCLICKDGQERSGCFLWNGRSIVVIGYFGCMTEVTRKAFKISKSSANYCAQVRPATTNGEHRENTNSLGLGAEPVTLFLSAAVLASAGDRTLERVLLLAAVMLRNQYLDAVSRVRRRCARNPFEPIKAVEMGVSQTDAPFVRGGMSSSDYAPRETNVFPPKTRDEVLVELGRRISKLNVYVEAAVDNYSSLKSLTENVAFLQCQTNVDPNMCMLELPDILFEASELEASDDVNNGSMSGDRHHNGANVLNAGVPRSDEVISNNSDQEDVMATFTMREEGNADDGKCGSTLQKEMAPKLKNGNERHDEKHHGQEAEKQENPGNSRKTIDGDAPVGLIRLRCDPPYAVSAFMRVSALLTTPSYIPSGGWIQYKLKDESEDLRQTLHSKDAIVAKWREDCRDLAGRYMGNNTAALLRRVQRLKREVEKARAIPLHEWSKENLMRTREGRICALHHSDLGTMLVGIRNRRECETQRRQEQRPHFSRMVNDNMGNTDITMYFMGSHDGAFCLGSTNAGHSSTSTLGRSVTTASTISPTPLNMSGTNMGTYAAFPGMSRMDPTSMFTQAPPAFPQQVQLPPSMQSLYGVPMGANFMTTPMMLPCYASPEGRTTDMELQAQQEILQPPTPTTTAVVGATVVPTLSSLYQHPYQSQQLPTGFTVDVTGNTLTSPFVGGVGMVRGGDVGAHGSTFSSSQLSIPSNANPQAPPYSYSIINSVTAPPGGNFLTPGVPATAPQQQFVMLPQGHGGMQVLMPVGSAPPPQSYPLPPPPQPRQHSSFLPSHPFVQTASGDTHVMMTPSLPVSSVSSWNSAQGSTVPGAAGFSNVIYYCPA